MQPNMALCDALLRRPAFDHQRMVMLRAQGFTIVDESPQFRHLGQNHRDDFEAIHFIFGILPRLARLHDENAKLFANALDRNTEKGGVNLLARLWHIAEALLGRSVARVDRLARARDAPYKPLTHPHPRLVDGLGLQALCGAEFKRFRIAEKIDRAHMSAHRIGDQSCDPVQPILPATRGGKGVAKTPQ